MKLYRLSPIRSEQELFDAIRYLHKTCHELCGETVGKNLPVSGNVGVFCHDYEEYEFLTKLRKKLTNGTNYNGKYFQLHQPIICPADGVVPAATYEFLYIRQVDPYRLQVGDIDFVMSPDEHAQFKEQLVVGDFRNGARIFERTSENMIELWQPSRDVVSYVVTEPMKEKIL